MDIITTIIVKTLKDKTTNKQNTNIVSKCVKKSRISDVWIWEVKTALSPG